MNLSIGAVLGGLVVMLMTIAAIITLERDPKGFLLVVFLSAVLFGGVYFTMKMKERYK